jgi:hypothetical protein
MGNNAVLATIAVAKSKTVVPRYIARMISSNVPRFTNHVRARTEVTIVGYCPEQTTMPLNLWPILGDLAGLFQQ